MDALDTLVRLWDAASDDDRKGMAQNLFTEMIYNLDTRRITGFRFKPWADRFLVPRASLYEEEFGTREQNETSQAFQGLGNDLPPRRFELLFWP